jgi:hypothetical protein
MKWAHDKLSNLLRKALRRRPKVPQRDPVIVNLIYFCKRFIIRTLFKNRNASTASFEILYSTLDIRYSSRLPSSVTGLLSFYFALLSYVLILDS